MKAGLHRMKLTKWPEEVLGPIDEALKTKGAALYDVHCKGCHLPPVQTSEFWNSKASAAANQIQPTTPSCGADRYQEDRY